MIEVQNFKSVDAEFDSPELDDEGEPDSLLSLYVAMRAFE